MGCLWRGAVLKVDIAQPDRLVLVGSHPHSMYTYTYTYTHIHLHKHKSKRKHTHTHRHKSRYTPRHIPKQTYLHTQTPKCTQSYTYTHVHTRTHTYTHRQTEITERLKIFQHGEHGQSLPSGCGWPSKVCTLVNFEQTSLRNSEYVIRASCHNHLVTVMHHMWSGPFL